MLWYIAAFKANPKRLPWLNTYSSNNSNKENNKQKCHKQESNKCPKCGALLKERKAPFKPSWECSNYPKCNYIKKLNDK